MSPPLSGFDDFLRRFREASGDPLLDYWADMIFVMRLQRNALSEKRLMGGLFIWLPWIIKTLVLEKRDRHLSVPPPDRAGHPIDGYRLLPTPAHEESLLPLIDQATAESARVYTLEEKISTGHPCIHLGLSRNLSALDTGERLWALWKSIRIWQRIRKTLQHCDPAEYQPRRDFHVRLLEQIFTAQAAKERLRKTEPPLRTLFLTYELSAESKALVMRARETGSRVVHVMHGQRLPTYQVTLATDLVLLSSLDRDWFRKRVPDNVNIRTEGHPRLEKLRREVSIRSQRAPLPKITFFSQPAELDYSNAERTKDWEILSSLRGKAEIRFRLHPRENPEDAIRNLLALKMDFVRMSDASLADDLGWCDGVASSWSTASMEAAVCGKGIFWTCSEPERYPVCEGLRKNGLGVLIQNPSDWDDYLARWANGPWGAPVVVPEARLRELGMIGQMDVPWLKRLGIEPAIGN